MKYESFLQRIMRCLKCFYCKYKWKEIVRKFSELGKEILPKTRKKRRKVELAKVDALDVAPVVAYGCRHATAGGKEGKVMIQDEFTPTRLFLQIRACMQAISTIAFLIAQ